MLWIGLVVLHKEYRPRLTPILLSVVFFLFIIGIANLFGADPYNSFWSKLERMEGYLMLLHLSAYFLMLTTVLRNKKDWLLFFNVFVIVGLLGGVYGVLQILGVKEAIQGGDTRIDGTIGNPTYFAIYISLIIALALILFFNAQKLIWKLAYGVAAAFLFIVLLFTASRGAAFAVAISVPLFLILYLIFFKNDQSEREKIYKKIAVGLLIFAVLAPFLFWLVRDAQFIQNSPVFSRLASFSLGEKTIKARFILWGMALKAFQENPILGWGQENFIYAFSKYYDPRLYDQEPWFDRPHNILFEWLVDGGLLGLFSYLLIFGFFFWGIKELLARKLIYKKEALVLISGSVAYLIQNFFVFDNFNTYIIFFGLLGYINTLLTAKSDENLAETDQRTKMISLGSSTLGLLVMVLIIYFVNVKPIRAAQGIIGALQATIIPTDSIGATLAEFRKTFGYKTFAEAETLEQLNRVAVLLVNRSGIENDRKIAFVQYVFDQTEEYLQEHPQNIRLHLILADLYQRINSVNAGLIFKARDHLKAALDLSPKKQQILFVLADNYSRTNEVEKMLELLERAAKADPYQHEAHVNVAIAGILTGRDDIVQAAISNLDALRKVKFDKRHPDYAIWLYVTDLSKIGNVYFRRGNQVQASAIYEQMLAVKEEALTLGVKEEDFNLSLENLKRK